VSFSTAQLGGQARYTEVRYNGFLRSDLEPLLAERDALGCSALRLLQRLRAGRSVF